MIPSYKDNFKLIHSRAAHALDISSHVAVASSSDLIATLPMEVDRHLMPAASLTLIALQLATRAFQLDHDVELESLNKRLLKVSGLK